MMYSDNDSIMYAAKQACSMAKTTINDIYMSTKGEALNSTELDDLHHCLEILKDVYVVKEMHTSWVEAHEAAACAHRDK